MKIEFKNPTKQKPQGIVLCIVIFQNGENGYNTIDNAKYWGNDIWAIWRDVDLGYTQLMNDEKVLAWDYCPNLQIIDFDSIE